MNKEFLKNLLKAYSPSGYEKNATSEFEDYMGTFNCKHEFSDPVYDPEEIVFFDTKRDRWYVDCKICGTRQV